MRKLSILLAASTLLPLSAARADNYAYLTFRSADGTLLSVAAESLTVSFADGKLVATDGTTTHELTLASLSSMYFTEADVTAIGSLPTADADGSVQAFSLSGTRLGTYASASEFSRQAAKGIYVIKGNGKTSKVIVR